MSFGGESWLIFPPYAANTDPSKLLFQSQSECWTQSVRKYIHAQTAPGIALVKLHTITHVKSEAITQAGVIVAGFNGQMQSVHYLACDFQSIAAPPDYFLWSLALEGLIWDEWRVWVPVGMFYSSSSLGSQSLTHLNALCRLRKVILHICDLSTLCLYMNRFNLRKHRVGKWIDGEGQGDSLSI